MHFAAHERTALFIDGADLFQASRALGFDVDFQHLLLLFRQRVRLIRAFYYTALREEEDHNRPLRPLVDWLSYNGFTVVTKVAKESVDSSGRRKLKTNMDIELAVDAIGLASALDHAVLFSGSKDYRALIRGLQQMGVRTSVVATLAAPQHMVADELRRQADQFIELAELEPILGRSRTPARANE